MTKESGEISEDWIKTLNYLETKTSGVLENPERWDGVLKTNPFLEGEKQGAEAEIAQSLARASQCYLDKNWTESRILFENVVTSELISNRGQGWIYFFIAKTYEKEGNYEKYRKYARKSYEVLSGIPSKFTIPISGPEDVRKILGNEYGNFPLYGFFLFSTFDQDIINFLNEHASWLHNSSGEDILLALFENPEKWGRGWKEYWEKKIGPGFDDKIKEWSALLPEDRDLAYNIADLLGVEKNILPCIVFVKSFEDKQILCVPLIQNKDNFRFYFEDLFTVVQEIKKTPAEDQFTAFQKEWKVIWVKWILPEKIKTYTKAIQEWGSIIIETKNTILSIIEPITPFIAPIKEIIS